MKPILFVLVLMSGWFRGPLRHIIAENESERICYIKFYSVPEQKLQLIIPVPSVRDLDGQISKSRVEWPDSYIEPEWRDAFAIRGDSFTFTSDCPVWINPPWQTKR